MGAADFFIGGDLNIELKLCLTDDEHWTVSNGVGCMDLSVSEELTICCS